jgi:CHAT domain-containing protein
MTRTLLFLLCLVSLTPVNTYAQATPPNLSAQTATAERELANAIERHRSEFGNLAARRGAVAADDPLVSVFRETLGSLTTADLTKAIRENYPSGTAILFYNHDQERFRVWIIDSRGIQGYSETEIPLNQIQAAIDDFRRALNIDKLQRARVPRKRDLGLATNPPSEVAPKVVELTTAVAKLTALLLPSGIAKAIGQTSNLIVVPTSSIGIVPFAILEPFGTSEILLNRMSISLAPSLFDVTVEKPEPWSAKFTHPLIVGNPQYTDKSAWSIPQLPGAQKEAETVAEMFQTKPLTGKDATKKTVLGQIGDADLLYFATHGAGDTRDSRNDSFLIFGPSENDLGFWTMAEILNAHQKRGIFVRDRIRSPLRARLAVLSACQTGLGETWKAGVLSLGRTMQVSGVPRVVMSLWNVSDQATVFLMKAFVVHLQKNEIPAEALRQAMLETRASYPSPAHWAAFVYFGMPY